VRRKLIDRAGQSKGFSKARIWRKGQFMKSRSLGGDGLVPGSSRFVNGQEGTSHFHPFMNRPKSGVKPTPNAKTLRSPVPANCPG
jgi:hypothetical protein